MQTLSVIPPDLQDSQMVKTADVARWFKVSQKTIYSWSMAGRLPLPIRLGPRTTLFNVGQLRDAVALCEVVDLSKE